MSVRIGTPARSRTCASTRRPSVSPGPRKDRSDVRFALSYDALKTNGTPAERVMSRSARAVSTAWDSLSMTQGPAISISGLPPMLAMPIRTGSTRLPYHGRRGGLPGGELVLVARFYEAAEERMRLERLRLELGMELDGDVPRMRRQLDDFHELPVE